MFNKIQQSYLRVIELLQAPMDFYSKEDQQRQMTKHLLSIKQSDMSVTTEMRALIDLERRYLLEQAEFQMKTMSVIVAIIVVISIFFFLSSAYSPIFILGETV